MDELKKIDQFDLNDEIDSEAFKKAFNRIYESVDTIDLSTMHLPTVKQTELPNFKKLLTMFKEKKIGGLVNITVTLTNPENFSYQVINKWRYDFVGWPNLRNFLDSNNVVEIKRVYFQYPGKFGVYTGQVWIEYYESNTGYPPGYEASTIVANWSWMKIFNPEIWPKFYHKDVKIKIQIELV